MSENKIFCTVPGCKKRDMAPDHMWIPERKARQTANGGKRTDLADFPRFALCGHHGHLLRQEGVRVYRYHEEVEREAKFEEGRAAEEMTWKPFAERFKTQSNDSGKSRKPTGDGRHVGQGLGKLSKEAAKKRADKEAAKPKPTEAIAEAPPKPTQD